MKHLDLFSGIGGFALAVDSVWPDAEHEFCEIDPFCRQVLKKHFPNSKIHGDIKALTYADNGRSTEQKQQTTGYKQCDRESQFDLLTGGFPCQPFSQAGKRRGDTDDRYLWPEMLRVIREAKPTWIVGENVAGIINMALEQVCLDLEAEGYEVQPFIIPACAVNAPHRRDRVWIVAHRKSEQDRGLQQSRLQRYAGTESEQATSNSKSTGSQRGYMSNSERSENGEERSPSRGEGQRCDWNRPWPEVAAELCRVDDGLPAELDGLKFTKSQHRVQRLKALGNSIVPQVAIEILKAIREQ